MITSEKHLDQTLDQLARMYRALAALKADVLPVNAQRFALMAEGPRDQIRTLQAELDAYNATDAAGDSEAAPAVDPTLQQETTHEQLISILGADPFQPFRIHMANGRTLDVRHRDFVARSPSGRTLLVYGTDDACEAVDLLLVSSLEVLNEKETVPTQ